MKATLRDVKCYKPKQAPSVLRSSQERHRAQATHLERKRLQRQLREKLTLALSMPDMLDRASRDLIADLGVEVRGLEVVWAGCGVLGRCAPPVAHTATQHF